ncbi:hypothetical protein FXO38_19451 [Capsicum annuum]|nr:hypothetical protein FXO38_19451 [Capsicum annuum]
MRTPAYRTTKAAEIKTPVFKPIPTRQAASSKIKKGKQTTRVIFPQVQSKRDSHVEEVAVSKPESHVEKETFISKKVFDAFRDEQQHEDKDPEVQQMDYAGAETSPQRFSPTVDQNLGENQDGTKGCIDLHPDKTNIEIDSQHLIPDEFLQSINLDYNLSEKIVHHDGRITDEKMNETNLSDSQFTIPDDSKSIIAHPSANREFQTLIQKLRIRRSSKFKESPYTMKFGSIAGLLKVHAKRSVHDVYSVDDSNLAVGGQEAHLNEYINRNCVVFMVTYAECLSYGHKVFATEFHPSALCTRYAALLWDYGIRKQEANAHSDIEAPLRPARQSRITSVTEVFDV